MTFPEAGWLSAVLSRQKRVVLWFWTRFVNVIGLIASTHSSPQRFLLTCHSLVTHLRFSQDLEVQVSRESQLEW